MGNKIDVVSACTHHPAIKPGVHLRKCGLFGKWNGVSLGVGEAFVIAQAVQCRQRYGCLRSVRVGEVYRR
jgi:hypothetical protein